LGYTVVYLKERENCHDLVLFAANLHRHWNDPFPLPYLQQATCRILVIKPVVVPLLIVATIPDRCMNVCRGVICAGFSGSKTTNMSMNGGPCDNQTCQLCKKGKNAPHISQAPPLTGKAKAPLGNHTNWWRTK